MRRLANGPRRVGAPCGDECQNCRMWSLRGQRGTFDELSADILGFILRQHVKHLGHLGRLSMLHTITLLLGEEKIGFQSIQEFELFDASGVSIEPQRWYAKHIIKFCANRTKIPESEFTIKLIKVSDKDRVAAQFGLAILVSAELTTDEILIAVKADLTALAPRLVEGRDQTSSFDFVRPDLPQDAREALESDIDDAVRALKVEFGGKRI